MRCHQPLATLGEAAREAGGARPGSGREISDEPTGVIHPLDPHVCLHEIRRERQHTLRVHRYQRIVLWW